MSRVAVTFRTGVAVLTFAVCVHCGQVDPALTFEQQRGYGHAGTFQVALGDLDGDGDLDAVFANMDALSEVWVNEGNGGFRNSYQRLGSGGHGVAIGDLDGDGDLDLFFTRASSEYASSVYFNDGSGRFQLGGQLPDRTLSGNFVSLFDLEGDGDSDAGVYYSSRFSQVYANDGTGHFEPQGERIPGMAFWGDLDGDGDADALAEQHGGGFAVWSNVGRGVFERGAVIVAPSPFFAGDAALCDLDDDGDLDLVSSNGGFAGGAAITVLVNDGAGAFTYAPDDRFHVAAGRLAIGDFNGDGAPDVLVCCLEQPDRIGLNDGRGGFVNSGILFGGEWLPGVPGIGDVDGDGDIDAFFARYDPPGPNEVWINTTE